MEILKVGILTVSDRAKAGQYDDKSGPAIRDFIAAIIRNAVDIEYRVVADNFGEIKNTLMMLSDKYNCSLIITTGGTGPSARDLTPDVTLAVCSRILPGFGELMRMESLKFVATAILSRQTAGIRGSSLIVNLPGNPKAILQCLTAVFPAIPDCVKLIGGPVIETNDSSIKIHH